MHWDGVLALGAAVKRGWPLARWLFMTGRGVPQDLEMSEGYLPSLKGFLKAVWPEYEPRP